ncbi:cytidylyltransferase domain-containing protein [Flocculibacter collagenilyticus]|uniref:cytidylyltransferase domain-containing protein n=1 Tax=Flocculibacter collagenilyticus TaxID=2744479 RepID=UPI0018F3E2B7|nr:glycosyltransferase family protein [Flocculibacter collagenilyticus]
MILAIVQARTSSSRLPHKVLKPLLGEPMLARQLERVSQAKLIEQLVVATSTEASDDELAKLCKHLNIACYRGDLNDVLKRFYGCAELYLGDLNSTSSGNSEHHIVRITGDCPLIDPELIDQVIQHHIENGSDYTSNCCPPTLPDGLDVEVFTFDALKRANREAKLKSEREHVTLYIRNQGNFKLHNVSASKDMSHHRWTVDELEDYQLVTLIYEALYPINPHFNYQDVLKLLEKHPHWQSINQDIMRNEGLEKSLNEDRENN